MAPYQHRIRETDAYHRLHHEILAAVHAINPRFLSYLSATDA